MITSEKVFALLSERLEVIIKAVTSIEEREFRLAMDSVFDLESLKIHLDPEKYSHNDILHISRLVQNDLSDRWKKVLTDRPAFNAERYQEYFQAVADLFGIEILKPIIVHPEIDSRQGYEIKKYAKMLEHLPGGPSSKDLLKKLMFEAAEQLDPFDQGVS